MRYAIVSDIHANLQAWQAVVSDCAQEGVTHIICLGDVVGYGPEPAETLSAVRRAVCAMAQGNHDAAAAGVLDPARFTEFAQKTARRAALALSGEAKKFLEHCPLILLGEGFAATHGGFHVPNAFYYVVTETDAAFCFNAQPERVLFVGHTHHASVFEREEETGVIRKRPPGDFTLREGFRYLINPGSVGFPRDADIRAAYVIYDSQREAIIFRRVAYDLDRFRLSVIRHGYHQADYWFLMEATEAVASQQSFSFTPIPLPEAAPVLSNAHAVDFSPSGERNRWLLPILFCVSLLFIFGLSILVIFAVPAEVELALPDPAAVPREAEPPCRVTALANWHDSILPPVPFTQGVDGALAGWRLAFSHQEHQQVLLQMQTAAGRGFRVKNTAKAGVVAIETPLLDLEETGASRFAVCGSALYLPGAAGTLTFRLTAYSGDAAAPVQIRADAFPLTPSPEPDERGTYHCDHTFTIDPATRFLRFVVQAEITGEVLLDPPAVKPLL